jgi:hypothetical protein
MHLSALASDRKLLLAIAAAAFLVLASTPSNAQDDPPDQAGRISYVSGAVSIQPVGADDWGQALPNLPLGPGDRIFTDSDGRAEIQVGQTFLRIGPNSDVSFVGATPLGISIGVAQGSIHVHSFGLWPGQWVHVNTPSGSLGINQPSQVRVDVLPDEGASVFTNFTYDALITAADGFVQDLGHKQVLELVGSNPVFPQWLEMADWDVLDQWSHQRDEQIADAASYRYMSPEIPGAYELDAAGTWEPGTEYGAVWFPNNVPADWAPYHYGHWINHAPWGWVWVEDEPWGYAPFHYGRWVSFRGRWGWVPGSPAAHPVWSPALVVFAGGVHVGGLGVSAWFPLGPGEPYRPWYPCSPRYVDQVNITNFSESPRVHIQTTYVNINVVNVTYVNRTIGVTAMRHEDFAAGRPAHQAAVVVDVHQLDRVQVMERPEPQPTRASFVGHPPARPVPVKAERPVLINEKGKLVSAKPGAQPVEPPVKPAPLVRALPGRTVVAPPPGAKVPARTPAVAAAPAAKPAPTAASPAKPATAVAPPARPAATVAPAAKPAPQPAVKAVTPPAAPAAAPTAKPATQPAAKPAPAPATAPAAKPAPQPGAKPPVQPDAKPAAQPATKPAPPAAAKAQPDKKNDKDKKKDDKKDEKKPEN